MRPKLIPRFNRGGTLEQLELDGSLLIEHIGYNAKGQRVLLISNCIDAMGTLQKQILTRYAHDAQTFRLLRQRSESCALGTDGKITPQASPLQDTGYLYDRTGNIHKILERVTDCGISATRNSLDRLFTYDALYRLLSATGRETEFLTAPAPAELLYDSGPWSQDITKAQAYKEEYTYDAVGFMEELKRTSYTPTGTAVHTRTFAGFVPMGGTTRSSNRLASVTFPDTSPMPGMPLTASHTYDAAGNQLTEGSSRHMEWDHSGRLRSFRVQTSVGSEPSVYTHYLYDAAGQRVKKLTRKQGGMDWDVLVCIDGLYEHRVRVRGTTTDEGQVLHLMDGQKRLGRRRLGETFDGKPTELLVLSDYLESANVELNWQSGALVDREEFRPYGETSFGSYVLKRYRFTGKERDEESGFSYHGARYYATWAARWISPDPQGSLDGTNLYAYVRNNPERFSDPDGREAVPSSQVSDSAIDNTSHNKENSNPSRANSEPSPVEPENISSNGSPASEKSQQGSKKQEADSKKGLNLPQAAGPGMVALHDSARRLSYKWKIKKQATTAINEIRAAREVNDLAKAEKVARDAMNNRNAMRTKFQGKVSPGAALLSRYIDFSPKPDEILASKRKPNPFDTFESAAKSSGKTRLNMTIFAYGGAILGPIFTAHGLYLAYSEVTKASKEEAPRVAAQQIGAIGGGAVGSTLGTALGVGVSVLILGSNPGGWAIGISILGSMAGG